MQAIECRVINVCELFDLFAIFVHFFCVCVKQRCVQVLLDHAVSLLYRPKHLKRLINSSAAAKDTQTLMEDDTFDDEVKAMNM